MIKITNNKNTEFLVEYVFKGENHIQTYYKIMGELELRRYFTGNI